MEKKKHWLAASLSGSASSSPVNTSIPLKVVFTEVLIVFVTVTKINITQFVLIMWAIGGWEGAVVCYELTLPNINTFY